MGLECIQEKTDSFIITQQKQHQAARRHTVAKCLWLVNHGNVMATKRRTNYDGYTEIWTFILLTENIIDHTGIAVENAFAIMDILI